jgi:hypothetical protein
VSITSAFPDYSATIMPRISICTLRSFRIVFFEASLAGSELWDFARFSVENYAETCAIPKIVIA